MTLFPGRRRCIIFHSHPFFCHWGSIFILRLDKCFFASVVRDRVWAGGWWWMGKSRCVNEGGVNWRIYMQKQGSINNYIQKKSIYILSSYNKAYDWFYPKVKLFVKY